MKGVYRLVLLAVLAATAAAALWFWTAASRQPARVRLEPQDARVVARGAEVYRAHCASCHGARLEGQPGWREPGPGGLLPAPPHDASGHTWHHPDDVLFRITRHGVAKAANLKDHRSAMPAFEGVLSDEDIVAALSWIKAQWPAAIRERHDKINTQYDQQAAGR